MTYKVLILLQGYMVIGKTLPYFHSQLYFLGNGMKKLIIKQEALKPSFVDTGGFKYGTS